MAKTTQATTKKSNITKDSTPSKFQPFIPHIVALVTFLVVTFIFFSPMIFENKVIQQGDITQFEGMSHEIQTFNKANSEGTLWTNSMFGGMPAFQISAAYNGNLIRFFDTIASLHLPEFTPFLLLSMLCFYILLIVLEVSPWLAIAGAIAYSLSSYNLIILEAGHNTKMHAIALVPLIFAGSLLVWKKKYILGAAVTAIGFSLLIYANHVQIAYYHIISFLVFGTAFLIYSIKEKELAHYAKSIAIIAVCGLLAVASNASLLWSTYEYGKDTIRGKSELTSNKQSNGGLDKDYAYAWSYGKLEAMTLMIPNFYGGSSHAPVLEGGKGESALRAPRLPYYWGAQPFTSGPVYVGAIICFLFILGVIVVDGPLMWWLTAATVLSILLSFGKNLSIFSDLFFNFLPGYNKFRTVAMNLVVVQLTAPLLGILAISKILKNEIEKEKLLNGLYIAGGLTASICLIFGLFGGGLLAFTGLEDAQLQPEVVNILKEDRAAILRNDCFRSFLFIAFSFGLIWAFVKEKINGTILMGGLGLLIFIDMVGVGKRYINEESFSEEANVQNRFQQTPADLQILQDKDPNYRVFNTTVNSFNDASTSYFHKSVGGYHAAKLRRYQELIENQIQKNNMAIFDMLNTKYFIVKGADGSPTAQQNPNALGNAWFVSNFKVVANADEELKSLDKFNPKELAFIDKRFESNLQGIAAGNDSSSNIHLTSYKPNDLVYKSNASKPSLALFSEIFYTPGWVATIDKKEVPIIRADYVLRALNIPAGAHEIEFKFAPSSYYLGEKIALISSLLILLLFVYAVFMEYKTRKTSDSVHA